MSPGAPEDCERLNRERDLLLTRFDPSEFDSSPTPVFTEPGPGFNLKDGLPGDEGKDG